MARTQCGYRGGKGWRRMTSKTASQLDLWSASVHAHVCMYTWVYVFGEELFFSSYSCLAFLGFWKEKKKKTQRNKSKTPVPSYPGRNRNMGAMTAALSS